MYEGIGPCNVAQWFGHHICDQFHGTRTTWSGVLWRQPYQNRVPMRNNGCGPHFWPTPRMKFFRCPIHSLRGYACFAWSIPSQISDMWWIGAPDWASILDCDLWDQYCCLSLYWRARWALYNPTWAVRAGPGPNRLMIRRCLMQTLHLAWCPVLRTRSRSPKSRIQTWEKMNGKFFER